MAQTTPLDWNMPLTAQTDPEEEIVRLLHDDVFEAADALMDLIAAQRYAMSHGEEGDPLNTKGDDAVGWWRIARNARTLSRVAFALQASEEKDAALRCDRRPGTASTGTEAAAR